MTPIDQAAEVFDVKPKELQSFDIEDPFNGHQLEGYMCRISDYRYGALYISQINGIPYKPQVIYGTPKMGYPFDRNGRFKWPKCKKINTYTKYDGTNILAYTYKLKDQNFVTYKTRLMPVLRAGKWGDFLSMWKEILEKYPQIPQMVLESGLHLSFELFGSRNKHLIIYDEPLDARLLFGVKSIIGNPSIVDPGDIKSCYVPIASGDVYKNPKDLTSLYKKLQGEVEATNKTSDFGISGSEGYMFYLHLEDGSVKQAKLKPSSIEKIAWAAGGLNKNCIRTTCINAFENHDEVTVDIVKELLEEEYEKRQIEPWHYRIVEVLEDVIIDMGFQEKVLDRYKHIGVSILEDKRTVMRAMSEHFPKNKMGYVYWIISSCA